MKADRTRSLRQAAPDRATRFIRMMILPRALLGKSSIEYLDPHDKEWPKPQSYQRLRRRADQLSAARRVRGW